MRTAVFLMGLILGASWIELCRWMFAHPQSEMGILFAPLGFATVFAFAIAFMADTDADKR